ncbi:hypothetical protein CY35_17G106900 [Sphagnum magellanicum]|nr:hypothetical protein CY35_17G106900 [Sphagnum magellanicum]
MCSISVHVLFFTSLRKSCALGTASLCGISQVPCHSLYEQFGNRIPLEEGLFMNLKGIFDIVRVAPPLTSFLLIHSLQLFWRLCTTAYEISQHDEGGGECASFAMVITS